MYISFLHLHSLSTQNSIPIGIFKLISTAPPSAEVLFEGFHNAHRRANRYWVS